MVRGAEDGELMPMTAIRLADWTRADDACMLLQLLDQYARHPMGGGRPLSDGAIAQLPERYAALPGGFSLLAIHDGRPVGLANCLTSFSTFQVAPRINIHDLFVVETARGEGLGRRLLSAVRQEAVRRSACALTLEVRCDNQPACRLYASFGFQGIGQPTDPLLPDGQAVYFFGTLALP